MARPGSFDVAWNVHPVRPVGLPAGPGLILPTIPWAESPAQLGSITGGTKGENLGTTTRLQALARGAERAGAGSIWACDHLFWHRPVLEPLTSLAVVAEATHRPAIGTCVLQLPLRNPAAVARQASTLQLLSEGRFVLGVGTGSHRGEYEAAGVEFAERGQRLDEGIGALRLAWSTAGDTEERYRQEPPVPTIPVWVGGSSEPALRRAGTLGDGWVPLFVPAKDYGHLRSRVADAATRAGRDPRAVLAAVVVVLCTGANTEVARKEGTLWLADLYDLPPKAFERHLLAGSPEDCAAAVAEYQSAGADHVVVMVAADETLDHFGPVAEALGRPTGPLSSDRSPSSVGVAP